MSTGASERWTVAGLRQHLVTIRGQEGYVFRSTRAGSAYCFVPGHCIYLNAAGQVGVNEVAYFASGWGSRNRRFDEADEGGNFLFPDVTGIVTNPESPEVTRFLKRLG